MLKKFKIMVGDILVKLINTYVILKSKRKIKSLKNSHYGERCFIIGNGPSLSIEDLDKLNNEFTIASHKIFTIFEDTNWRPKIYTAQDHKLILKCKKEISDMKVPLKIIALVKKLSYKKLIGIDGVDFIEMRIDKQLKPIFSKDVSKCIYEGMTVSFMNIQLAVYMGFKEIYLLGIDHSYSIERKSDNTIVINNDLKNYFSDKYVSDEFEKGDFNLPCTDKSTLAYISAKKYADENNIVIKNATRGGKLEVFERIDFDLLLEDIDDV